MTVVVTRSVEDRYRGFLSSCMLELSAGVYVSPSMSGTVRDRIWSVMKSWHQSLGTGTVLMVWRDRQSVGEVGKRLLGDAPKDIVDVDGVFLTRTG